MRSRLSGKNQFRKGIVTRAPGFLASTITIKPGVVSSRIGHERLGVMRGRTAEQPARPPQQYRPI
jgi:hypothetical protein